MKIIKGKGKPGSFEWWASIVPYTTYRGGRRLFLSFITPQAQRQIKLALRPTAAASVLKGDEWRSPIIYPSKGNKGPTRETWWLRSRGYPFGWFTMIQYWVPAVSVRRTEGLQFVVLKHTRSHRNCAAHMRRIERIWALYCRYPTSLLAQQMLVACANSLRRRGRVIPPLGKPVSLKELATFTNMELRRVIVEIRGVKLPKKPLAEDRVGRLYQVDQNQNLLEVRCPSTGRRYLLGVPAIGESGLGSDGLWESPTRLDTPTKAQRWTLGLTQGRKVSLVAQT